jgi:hypothetical protein
MVAEFGQCCRNENLLDPLPLASVADLQRVLGTSLMAAIPDVCERINKTGALDDKDRSSLLAHVKQTLASLTQGIGGESDKHGATGPT